MHYTQNDKIRQATEGTIVVGVDVGSEKNYARAFKGNGIEITRKAFCFANTLEGFKAFDEMVTKLTVPPAEKKIVVGMEPTGHYWFNFADYCQGKKMTVVTVAPQHVKHSKEMDDNTQRKDDRKDPRVIAKLVIEGRYCMLDTLEAWEVCARYLPERIEKTKNEPRFSSPFLREELEIAPDHYSGNDREVYYSREDRRFHTYVQHWDGGNMFVPNNWKSMQWIEISCYRQRTVF